MIVIATTRMVSKVSRSSSTLDNEVIRDGKGCTALQVFMIVALFDTDCFAKGLEKFLWAVQP